MSPSGNQRIYITFFGYTVYCLKMRNERWHYIPHRWLVLFVHPGLLVRKWVAITLLLRAVEEEIACPNLWATFFRTEPAGCLIRSWRNVNDDIAIFTKFSLVYQSENEKPQSNFYILVNNAIFTYHELNLNWFWVIAHGESVNWKFARKCDIWILSYGWFSKECR